ncbi:hypothetical protein [Flavobacterium sp. N1994]|uniref:hypothetical protein n=1 Tax=Flavobacterium sp. N1994 TaxID=2986827 RepID=UPI0022216E76|nr:hypothetical protein [Flavobacterium sp. N1994]
MAIKKEREFHYHLEAVVERLKLLDNVISFLFEEIPVNIDGEIVMRKRDILTDGEKICVNQERASMREYREYIFGNMAFKDVRKYLVSQEIEDKIQKILTVIILTGWEKQINEIDINE